MSSSEDEDMGAYSDDGASSSFYYRYSLGSRSKTPPRAESILSYDVKYVEGSSAIGKTMYVYLPTFDMWLILVILHLY